MFDFTPLKLNNQPSDRIKHKYDRIIDGLKYIIIEVDSVEYLVCENSGIIKLEKKT